MVAKAHDVAQQAFLVDGRAGVADLHAAPVGLAGDQAIALEQVADQGFGHGRVVVVGLEQVGARRVVAAFDVQAVQVQALQFLHLLQLEGILGDDTHAGRRLAHGGAAPQGLVDVLAQALLHGL